MLLISVKQQQQQQKQFILTTTTTIHFIFISNETPTTFLKEFNF